MVNISYDVLDVFAAAAHSNTLKGIETLGLLCGTKNENGNTQDVVAVVLPDQTGTSTSCELTDHGNLQLSQILHERGLVQLGWIHVRSFFHNVIIL
jgi:STAM-binding protein